MYECIVQIATLMLAHEAAKRKKSFVSWCSSHIMPHMDGPLSYIFPWILPNLKVATTARHAEHAPMNKQTAIPLGPSVL